MVRRSHVSARAGRPHSSASRPAASAGAGSSGLAMAAACAKLTAVPIPPRTRAHRETSRHARLTTAGLACPACEATVASDRVDLNEWRSDDSTRAVPVPPNVDVTLRATAGEVRYGALIGPQGRLLFDLCTPAEIRTLAARYGATVAKRLLGGAEFFAEAFAVGDLGEDGDVVLRLFLSVPNCDLFQQRIDLLNLLRQRHR